MTNPLVYLRETVKKNLPGSELVRLMHKDPDVLNDREKLTLEHLLGAFAGQMKRGKVRFPSRFVSVEVRLVQAKMGASGEEIPEPNNTESYGYYAGTSRTSADEAMALYVDAFREWLGKGKSVLGGRTFSPAEPLMQCYPTRDL
ncbi:hypothetical protein HY642_03900 [Candidatus Woesearchaeota archaeon]|nr:hypothetical protein [Candidatus Woesearchaeota archaeon]